MSKAKKPAKKTPKQAKGKAKVKATTNGKLGPVAMVWDIASKMPKAERKDVIAACVAKGINIHTAKTQYFRWSHASAAQRNGKVAEAKEQKEEPVAAK